MRPVIGITLGDPAGIGPEIAVAAALDCRVREACDPRVYGSATLLRALDPAVAPWLVDTGDPEAPIVAGRMSAAGARVAVAAIERAVADCRSGALDAMATAPISKAGLAAANVPFPGHTELLAALTSSPEVAMMFVAPRLRVALLTIHEPLARVPALVTRERVERTVRLVLRELPRLGVARPRLAVAGFNPHAGEDGLFGDEEARAIAPAIAACRAEGFEVSGPYPADTVFLRAARGEFDAVLACYHDQGLIPVKMAAFGHAVNVTIGLPIIRTSVDHGTAYDIAGQRRADPESMINAVLLAADLAARELRKDR